jgi:NitT/TauT family transport system substrate-binding protein
MGFIRESEFLDDAKFMDLAITDVKPLISNELIDEINDFDRDKIIADAKAYRI